jgi:hypothetical protein
MRTRASLPSRQDSCLQGHRRKRPYTHVGSRIHVREIGTAECVFQGMEFDPREKKVSKKSFKYIKTEGYIKLEIKILDER